MRKKLKYLTGEQLDLFANARVGKLPNIVQISDIDKIVDPHGEAAREAFERDLCQLDNIEDDDL